MQSAQILNHQVFAVRQEPRLKHHHCCYSATVRQGAGRNKQLTSCTIASFLQGQGAAAAGKDLAHRLPLRAALKTNAELSLLTVLSLGRLPEVPS
jgi:hypothetical protein